MSTPPSTRKASSSSGRLTDTCVQRRKTRTIGRNRADGPGLVRAALKQAVVRIVRMHDLRHGCVSVLLGLGVPPRTVREIAGHSGLEMTVNVYGHVSLDDKRDALDKLGTLCEEA